MSDLDPWLSERLAASTLFVDAEQRVEAAVRDTVARWLAAVRRLVLGDAEGGAVVAAGPPDLGGFASSEPDWTAAFNQIARPVLEDLFSERFLITARTATISDQPYRQAYIEEVFSRLVLFPAEQFEEIRPELEEAISEGETIEGIRSRIEAILDFDTAADATDDSHAESRRLQARINQLEKRLEQPGITQQEAAELRAERRRLYPAMYASRRRWQWKAQRIARTETSGALNGGSYWGALANAEIFGERLYKQWLSTDDERTRPTHVAAEGQIRRIAVPFVVGGAPLRHPSDPLGLPHETIQCRCTALYLDADELDDDQRAAADADPQADGEGASTLEPLDDVPGAVDALTTTPAQAGDGDGEGELVEGADGPVFVPAALLGERVPADLEPFTFDQLVAAYPRHAAGDVDGSLRVLERLDALESLANAAAAQAGDAAVEAMVEAVDVAGAVEAVADAWGRVADAWAGEGGPVVPAPWARGEPAPEPRGKGPGLRYDPAVDDTVVDDAVPAGWVLYEDEQTGARSYYEAAGMPKQLSRAARVAEAKMAYADWVHAQFLDAEAATRGNLFSRQGLAAGASERALWTSNAVTARAWASEELLTYWRDHPRLTQIEWLYQQTREERYRAQAVRAAENNARILGTFALVAASPSLATDAPGEASAVVAAAGPTAYSRAQMAGAWVAGERAGAAGLEVGACPFRPRVEGLLALLWVRAWRTQGPQTIIASGETTIMADLPNGWRGVLAALDVPTGDNRIVRTPEGGVRLRTPPLSLLWQERLAAGHDGAVVAGRIDRAWLGTTDSGVQVIMGEGPLDLGGEHGREAARLMAEGYFNGASMDPDEVTFREEFHDAAGAVVDPEGMDLDDFYDAWDAGDLTLFMVMTDWRMMGATLTSQPAFNETRLEALFDYAPTGAQAGDLEAVLAAAGEHYEPLSGPLVGAVVQPVPAEHYDDPHLSRLTPLTVTDDGRVFGHIAGWDSCHVGFGDTCIAAPRSLTAYAHFHLGEIVTDRGRLAAGKLTHGGGHADPKLGYRAAIEHYDNVASAVCGVRAGEDEFGIWVAGRVLAGVDAPTIERFLLCPPSGDWRRIGGNLELVAACSVAVPGFPVPRTLAAAAGGIQGSLIAAGTAPLLRARRRRDRARGPVDVDTLARRIAKEVRAYDARAVRADQLARRLGRDPSARAARAMTRLDDNRGA